MVLVAAAICTRSGAIVVSRQFLPITRQRIESLLIQFPRLLQAGQQHTFVESEEVRLVYQPLEAHYLVLITSKASNILQDMETLRLLTRVVAEYEGHADDPTILQDCALEILLSFDEVATLGYRENVNMSQLQEILKMESQEEIIQEIIAKVSNWKFTNFERIKCKKQRKLQRERLSKLKWTRKKLLGVIQLVKLVVVVVVVEVVILQSHHQQESAAVMRFPVLQHQSLLIMD